MRLLFLVLVGALAVAAHPSTAPPASASHQTDCTSSMQHPVDVAGKIAVAFAGRHLSALSPAAFVDLVDWPPFEPASLAAVSGDAASLAALSGFGMVPNEAVLSTAGRFEAVNHWTMMTFYERVDRAKVRTYDVGTETRRPFFIVDGTLARG